MTCYLVDRSSSSIIESKTPKEIWSGKPVDYSRLQVYDCLTYARASDSELEPKAKNCIFMGYAYEVKGYGLWCTDPGSPSFLVSKDMIFNKTAMLRQRNPKTQPIKQMDHGVSSGVKLQLETLKTSAVTRD